MNISQYFIADYFLSYKESWQEVDVILLKISGIDIENASLEDKILYDGLCKSMILLISSHLEGYIKNLIKNFISELNEIKSFNQLPEKIKLTYCNKYFGDENHLREVIHRKKELIKKLDNYPNYKIEFEPFLKNKNAKETVIETYMDNCGLKEFFKKIGKTSIENIFEGSRNLEDIYESFVNETLMSLQQFPYKFDFSVISDNNQNRGTLWTEFCKDLISKRNAVAHGNILSNITSISELTEIRKKTEILEILMGVFLVNTIIWEET